MQQLRRSQLKPLLRAPAIRALGLQFLALALTVAIVTVFDAIAGTSTAIWVAAAIQGIFASVLSYWRRLAIWWIPIQFLFPISLLLVLALHLPPSIFLAAFLFLLVLYWSTFRTQVPYYPSTLAVWRQVAALLPQARAFKFIDIGCGFGGMTLHVAALRHDGQCTGIELAPLPWAVSALRACLTRSRAKIVRGNYAQLNFADFDVVFAYLSPAAMPALWEKAHKEMRAGSLLLSYEFAIPNHAPDVVLRPREKGPALYGWRM
ncbi:MAG: class I SAM-dependent methyltransferase [Burkholderiales bacterium]|nr:class I SAM-dependent methyltransferase [Burkholderiales bacterium]